MSSDRRARSPPPRKYNGMTGRDTNSNDKNALRRRVFVGNLATDQCTKLEIEEMFGKFGPLESCSLHNNFGFVQFVNDKDADAAVLDMHGKTLFGKRVDVNLAGLRRKTQTKDQFDAPPPKEEVVPENMMNMARKFPPKRHRSRSPVRGDYGRPLSPMSRYEELYRRDDPHARYVGRDPYDLPRDRRDYYPDRRDDYPPRYERDYPPQDDYRHYDGYRAPPRRPPIDCEIVALSKEESRYAEEVESRLRSIGLVCNIGFPPQELPVLEVIDRIAHAGTLFAVVVSGQNAEHRSCTLNVLHGTRQEHRNMPLNDALSFVARNFDAYLKALRAPPAPYWGGHPPASSSYAPRDDPRGYPPTAGYQRPPPATQGGVPPVAPREKDMSTEELAAMIEKLKREKEQREAMQQQQVSRDSPSKAAQQPYPSASNGTAPPPAAGASYQQPQQQQPYQKPY